MGDPDRRLVLLDVLAACAARPERIDLEIALVDIDLDIVDFGQHCDRRRAGMDPPLAFRRRNTLYAMNAALILQAGKGTMTFDLKDRLFEAAHARLVGADHLDFPALVFGVAGIHTEQVTGENTRLVAARPGTNLHDNILLIARVPGQQQQTHFFFDLLPVCLKCGKLFMRQRAHFLVITFDQCLSFVDLFQRAF